MSGPVTVDGGQRAQGDNPHNCGGCRLGRACSCAHTQDGLVARLGLCMALRCSVDYQPVLHVALESRVDWTTYGFH